MEKANNSFISSTFWSDRVGPAAALKTLEIMEKDQTWLKLKKLGDYFKYRFKLILNNHNIKGDIVGTGSLLQFKIDKLSDNELKISSNRNVKKNILASNVIYLSVAHNKNLLEKYFFHLDKILLNFKKNLKTKS